MHRCAKLGEGFAGHSLDCYDLGLIYVRIIMIEKKKRGVEAGVIPNSTTYFRVCVRGWVCGFVTWSSGGYLRLGISSIVEFVVSE